MIRFQLPRTGHECCSSSTKDPDIYRSPAYVSRALCSEPAQGTILSVHDINQEYATQAPISYVPSNHQTVPAVRPSTMLPSHPIFLHLPFRNPRNLTSATDATHALPPLSPLLLLGWMASTCYSKGVSQGRL